MAIQQYKCATQATMRKDVQPGTQKSYNEKPIVKQNLLA
jgi:hypothetical protein